MKKFKIQIILEPVPQRFGVISNTYYNELVFFFQTLSHGVSYANMYFLSHAARIAMSGRNLKEQS